MADMAAGDHQPVPTPDYLLRATGDVRIAHAPQDPKPGDSFTVSKKGDADPLVVVGIDDWSYTLLVPYQSETFVADSSGAWQRIATRGVGL